MLMLETEVSSFTFGKKCEGFGNAGAFLLVLIIPQSRDSNLPAEQEWPIPPLLLVTDTL